MTLGLAVQPDFLNEKELINQTDSKTEAFSLENDVDMETSSQVKRTPRSSPRLKNGSSTVRAESMEGIIAASKNVSRRNSRSASPIRKNTVEKKEHIPLVRQSPNQVLKSKEKIGLSTPAVVRNTPASAVLSQNSASVFRVGGDKMRKTPTTVLPSKTLFENLVKAKAFANLGPGGYGTPRPSTKDERTPKNGSPLDKLTSKIEDISLGRLSEKSGTRRARSASSKTKQL